MEVGDYVRTKEGIEKIKVVEENFMGDENCIFYATDNKEWNGAYNGKYNGFTNRNRTIIKSSPNIIDLIEVGDYVNGMEVTGIGGTRWDKNDLHCYCEHNGNENWKRVMIPAKDIESIVTKEQFEEMEYRL